MSYSFRKIHSYLKDGAELRNLLRLFGGDASDGHTGGGAATTEEKKGGAGGTPRTTGGGQDNKKPQVAALQQIFFDEKSKKFYCYEHLQGPACDAKKCNFLHDDNLSPVKKEVLLKALKALKAAQGGAKPSPSK